MVSLDFENVDVQTAIDYIAEKAQVNIVCGKDVSGSITIRVANTYWLEALNLIVKTAGYTCTKYGDVYYLDLPANITMQPVGQRRFSAYKIRTEKPKRLAEQVEELLSPDGIVFADARTGQIIVYDYEAQQVAVQNLISKLNTPIRDVWIDLRVINISTAANDAVGITWTFPDSLIPLQRIILNTLDIDCKEDLAGYLRIHITTIDSNEISAILNMLSERSYARTILSSAIRVQDHYEASIINGERFSILTRDQSGNAVQQMYSTGLKMTVTPHIASSNRVILVIEMELSEIDKASVMVGKPIVTTLNAKISMNLADGETGILAEHSAAEESETEKGPLIHSIPIIKYLYQPWSNPSDFAYCYIMVTPHIIK